MIARLKTGLKIAAAALSLAAPAPMAAETLADALISAYRHSGLLEQQRALLRAADEDVAVAISALRPTLNYALSGTWKNTQPLPGDSLTLSASLTAKLVLYDFGRTDLRVKLARENVLATREMLVSAEQKVLLRAVSAFLDMRSAAEKAALQASNVRLLTEELRAARDRFEVGEITQTDVSLAEARLAGARAAEAAANGELIAAREEYKAAIGHYPGTLSPPPTPPVTVKTLEEARALALSRHPDMLTAQRNVTIAELNVELALAAMKPTLSASASAAVSQPHGGTATYANQVDVTLSGPLYQGGRLSALYRRAQAQRDAARAALHVTASGIEQGVSNAWAGLAVAAAAMEAHQRQIRATTVALRATREEHELGSRTMLDVLNAEQTLLDARASAISTQSEQYLAVYQLLSAMGLLTADYLNLGIATYDPEAYYNTVKDAPLVEVSPQGKRLDAVLEALGRDR